MTGWCPHYANKALFVLRTEHVTFECSLVSFRLFCISGYVACRILCSNPTFVLQYCNNAYLKQALRIMHERMEWLMNCSDDLDIIKQTQDRTKLLHLIQSIVVKENTKQRDIMKNVCKCAMAVPVDLVLCL